LILAWPTARIAVMGGAQAAETLMQIQSAKREREGEVLTDKQKAALLKEIQDRYDAQTSPYYAAARLWVDELIDPVKTRLWLSTGIEMANHNPDIPRFNPGIIQT